MRCNNQTSSGQTTILVYSAFLFTIADLTHCMCTKHTENGMYFVFCICKPLERERERERERENLHSRTNRDAAFPYIACAPRDDDSDRHAHLCSPIRIFAVRLNLHWIHGYLRVPYEDSSDDVN